MPKKHISELSISQAITLGRIEELKAYKKLQQKASIARIRANSAKFKASCLQLELNQF